AGQPADTTVDRAFADRLATLAALDQLGAFHRRTADRALLGYMHSTGIPRAALGDHTENLRDDVAGAPDDHRVADNHAHACYFIHIVQGRVGDGHACDLHRLEPGDRRDGAGTADLEFDVEQLGDFFARGKLVSDSPARLARAETQLALLRDGINLEHHAVDL